MSDIDKYRYNIEIFQFYIYRDPDIPPYDLSTKAYIFYKSNIEDDNINIIRYNTIDKNNPSYIISKDYKKKYDYGDIEDFINKFDKIKETKNEKIFNNIKYKTEKYILLKIELIDDYDVKYNYIISIDIDDLGNCSLEILSDNYNISFNNKKLYYRDILYDLIIDDTYKNDNDDIRYNRKILYTTDIYYILSNLDSDLFISLLLYILINKFTYPKNWISENMEIDHDNSNIKYTLNENFKMIMYNKLTNFDNI